MLKKNQEKPKARERTRRGRNKMVLKSFNPGKLGARSLALDTKKVLVNSAINVGMHTLEKLEQFQE